MAIKSLVKQVPVVKPKDMASKARAQMRESRSRAVAVVERNKLLGILTRSDILKISSSKSNISVKGLLWKPLVTVDSSSTPIDAAKLLIKNGIKQVAVFDGSKYLGVIRDIDVLRSFQNKDLSPNKKKIKDIMKKRIKTFFPDDTVEKVWLSVQNHSGFPVLEKKKVVGLISSNDLLKHQRGRPVRESSNRKTSTRVSSLMRTTKGDGSINLILPETTVQEAVRVILKSRSNILPVVNKNRNIVGIVSRKDLLKAYL